MMKILELQGKTSEQSSIYAARKSLLFDLPHDHFRKIPHQSFFELHHRVHSRPGYLPKQTDIGISIFI